MNAVGRAAMKSRSVVAIDLEGNGPFRTGTFPGSRRISHVVIVFKSS